MYLCDQMNAIVDAFPQDDAFLARSPFLSWMRARMAEILQSSELFILEESALAAAGSLKVGDPRRLEAMMELLLSEPRRIFVECSYKQRETQMSTLHGARQELPEGRFKPHRIGLDINITEPGKAIIQPIWSFPRGYVDDVPEDMLETRLQREALARLSGTGISYGRISVDRSKVLTDTPEDFRASLSRSGVPEELDRAARNALGGAFTQKQYREALWREHRMNAHSGFELHPDAIPAVMDSVRQCRLDLQSVVNDAYRDLDGELIFAIAQLAVLKARSEETVFKVKERPRQERRRVRRERVRDMTLPKVSILDMHKARRAGPAGRGGSGDGKSRIRHPVKGHLFLARNGEMVWRREHFRGTLEGFRARRVR